MATDPTRLTWVAGPDGSIRTVGGGVPSEHIGVMNTQELAEAACAAHNAELARKKMEERGVRAGTMTGVQFGHGNTQVNQW